MGAFSFKFSIAPSGETTDRIKKSSGCENGTDLLYHHAKCGGDRGSFTGCRRKSVMFFCLSVCLSRFGITKFVVMEMLWSSVIFKTIMVPLHRGRFLVVHPQEKFWGSIGKLKHRCTTTNLPLCNDTIIVLKIILLHSVSVITKLHHYKAWQKTNKVEINMHHIPKAMQYRQALWAILTKFCVVDGFLSLLFS